MPPVDVLVWLNQKQDAIMKRWQSAIREQHIGTFTALPDPELREQVLPLYQVVTQAVDQQSSITSNALLTWTQTHHERGTSLTDLLKASFALRTAVGDVLLESSDPWQAVIAWQKLLPYFDQATTALSEIYTRAVEQTLTQRLHEAESLANDLAQATEDTDRALVQLRSIFDVSQVVGATLDVDEIVNQLAEKLGQALEARHCAVWLNDMGAPRVVAFFGDVDTTAIPLLPDDTENVFRQVLDSTTSQVLTADQDLCPGDCALIKALNVGVLLVAPLTIQGIAIGVLTLGRRIGAPHFDATEINLAEAILRQAAVAIQNAGLYEEISALNNSLEMRIASRIKELAREKERIQTLYDISSGLSASLDIDFVLDKTLRLVTQAVGAEHGSVMFYDRERNTLIYRARLGGQGLLPPEGEVTPFKPGVGVAGWILEYRRPVLIDDVTLDDRWLNRPGAVQTRSLIGAPLTIGEEILGVILVSNTTPKSFDEPKLRLVIAAAQQVAQAIYNAQLYNHVQENATRNQAILQSIADGVIVNDPKHQVIVFNAAAERILKTSQARVLGQDARRLFNAFEDGGRQSALAAMEMISAPDSVQVGQAVETTLEAEGQVISAHIAPVMTDDGDLLGVVTALRDITREVQADRAKTEFVSTVSHELRTPLTSIKGYTDLLFAGAVGTINDTQKHFLGIIKNNADRLTALINDLLDISRIETGRIKLNMQAVNMMDVINEVVESLHGQIEQKGLQLQVTLPSVVPSVNGDRARLIQIVTNLLSNAYKYTDEGGIHISLTLLQGAIRIDFTDSGIGISSDDMSKIFERFYRADTPVVEGRGGTGLGLSITKQLTELHGGRIWVQSELGVGSTFTIVLPTLDQKLTGRVLEKIPANAQKILVVDDERDIVTLLRHQLEAKGYQVIVASTGAQAIEKAIQEQPSLITLDILLPDRNGFEVLRELKEHPETAQIPVIVLSVVQDETSGYRLGAVDYITKPVNEERLLKSVSRVLEQKGKVLIAEDDLDTAKMLIDLLESNHYQAFHALDGYEALSLARREQPGLILLDLRMPGMDGYEALTRLKKDPETRQIPILAMSAQAGDTSQERIRLQEMGALDFFAKPFDIDDLLAEIVRARSQPPQADDAANS